MTVSGVKGYKGTVHFMNPSLQKRNLETPTFQLKFTGESCFTPFAIELI
jgi:hypothetical protein